MMLFLFGAKDCEGGHWTLRFIRLHFRTKPPSEHYPATLPYPVISVPQSMPKTRMALSVSQSRPSRHADLPAPKKNGGLSTLPRPSR